MKRVLEAKGLPGTRNDSTTSDGVTGSQDPWTLGYSEFGKLRRVRFNQNSLEASERVHSLRTPDGINSPVTGRDCSPAEPPRRHHLGAGLDRSPGVIRLDLGRRQSGSPAGRRQETGGAARPAVAVNGGGPRRSMETIRRN